jgi:hypothetical protein
VVPPRQAGTKKPGMTRLMDARGARRRGDVTTAKLIFRALAVTFASERRHELLTRLDSVVRSHERHGRSATRKRFDRCWFSIARQLSAGMQLQYV